MRISPILTIGTLARSLAGGAEGRVRGAGAARGRVVAVVGGSGRSSNTSATDAAAATDSPGWRSSTATMTPLISTTRISRASTGTVGTRQSRRGRLVETGASAEG